MTLDKEDINAIADAIFDRIVNVSQPVKEVAAPSGYVRDKKAIELAKQAHVTGDIKPLQDYLKNRGKKNAKA